MPPPIRRRRAARPEKPDDSLLGRDASRSDVNDRLCFAVKNAQQSISVVLTAASHSVRREAAIRHYALRYAERDRGFSRIMLGLMGTFKYRGRRAAVVENDALRVTILVEGGHIAEILDKRTGVSPLWIPSWPSIEPSNYSSSHAHLYGGPADGPLLAGIMGHNLCLDIFGGPSDEEAVAGLTAHGEGSIVPYELDTRGNTLSAHAVFPLASLEFERRLELRNGSIEVTETLTNLSACDRPIGWTQHVTLGPPFLQHGSTEFRTSATRSRVFESTFGAGDYLAAGADFDWPHAPRSDGGTADLQRFSDAPSSSAYTCHLMDRSRDNAFFVAFSASPRLAFGYVWRRRDFPWLGIWEENRSRTASPWNGIEVTRGMEFGASPFPETRRRMIDRGRLFDEPTYRWIPAHRSVTVDYRIHVLEADVIPETLGFTP